MKDDALDDALATIKAPDRNTTNLCNTLRRAVEGAIRAGRAITGVCTLRGSSLQLLVSPNDAPARVVEHVPLALKEGGSLLEYISQGPDTTTAALTSC